MAHPRLDLSSLRDQYGLHLQVGGVLALALLLGATGLPLSPDREREPERRTQAPVALRRIQPVQQEQGPSRPPKPPVPKVVPDEEIAASSDVEFDASLPLVGAEQGAAAASDVQGRPDCGGHQAIQEKRHYPPSALQRGLEGRVRVQFVVSEEGETEDLEVVRGAHEVLNQAALRTVQRLECVPGTQRSRPVRVRMTMPVRFDLPRRLESEE